MSTSRKNHIIKINFPGGIIPAGDLLIIAETAAAARLEGIRFGRRQQVLLEVPAEKLEKITLPLENHGLSIETDTDNHPNIVSACVAEQAFYASAWLKEGVYKDVLDAFDYRPRLSVNLVDKEQNLVPWHTGQLNFIASGIGNYWHLLWRTSPGGHLLEWRSLVYSGNIPRLVRRLETLLLDTLDTALPGKPDPRRPDRHTAAPLDKSGPRLPAAPARDEATIYQQIMQAEQWTEQPSKEKLSFPDFSLPYYEGFNRSRNERLWLGIYRREERFAPAFVVDLCKLCLRTKIGQLHATPWKSIIIPGIAADHRGLWDIVLGRHSINVRHSLAELSWQVEELSDEGLSLKRHLVRQFDQDDVRTFGLYFGVELEPNANIYPLVMIRKESPGKYQIYYKKEFDLRADHYILFRSKVKKEDLATYLKSLCKYFYECRAGEEQLLHHVFRETTPKAATEAPAQTTVAVYQCQHCATLYDPVVGDPDAGIVPGTPFEKLTGYRCPVCEADKMAFSPKQSDTNGVLCI